MLQVLRDHERRIKELETALDERAQEVEDRFKELSKKSQAAKRQATKELEQLRSELDALIGATELVIAGELAPTRRQEIKNSHEGGEGTAHPYPKYHRGEAQLMLSREARITLLTVKASVRYGPSIVETASALEELIALVKALDPVPKREAWPRRMIAYLAQQQNGVCPECGKGLPALNDCSPHVDHVVPWVQGGDNAEANLRLVHAHCNLRKGDACSPDDVIRHLQSRLMNLRETFPHQCSSLAS